MKKNTAMDKALSLKAARASAEAEAAEGATDYILFERNVAYDCISFVVD